MDRDAFHFDSHDGPSWAVAGVPMAILPAALSRLHSTWRLQARDQGGRPVRRVPPESLIAAGRKLAAAGTAGPVYTGRGTIAVMTLFGPLDQRDGLVLQMMGGTGLEGFCYQLQGLAANPDLKSIVVVADSPGGSVYYATEAAAIVRDAAKEKRVVACVSPLCASAAYWVLSGATEIVCQPSGMIGSVGVIAVHQDMSGALAKQGIKVSVVTSSKYKDEGDPSQPFTDEARSYLQQMVNAYGDMFHRDIAKGRGVSESKVRSQFGQGRLLTAADAVRVGMADRVGTPQEVINGLRSGAPSGGRNLPGAIAARLARIMGEM